MGLGIRAPDLLHHQDLVPLVMIYRVNAHAIFHMFGNSAAWDGLRLPLMQRYPEEAPVIMVHSWFYVVDRHNEDI